MHTVADCDPAYAVLGAPGAGKGTVCKWLRKLHGWGHLESGERFRQLIKADPGSDQSQYLARFVPVGELVPDDVVMQYAEAWLEDTSLRLFDGIPRTDAQCARFDELLWRKHGRRIKRALFIKVSRSDLKARLPFRKVCLGCAAIWNDLTKPSLITGVCDDCGGALQARTDDTPALVDRRQDIFESLYGPVLAYYGRQGILREIVYTNDMKVDDLYAAVAACL
jgi:adenylate kinase